MTQDKAQGTPQSPEVQGQETRAELDQDNVTHQGDYRQRKDGPGARGGGHLGATDDEVVPIVAPMAGPADLIGQNDPNAQGNETGDTKIGEEMIDPRDELTPG